MASTTGGESDSESAARRRSAGLLALVASAIALGNVAVLRYASVDAVTVGHRAMGAATATAVGLLATVLAAHLLVRQARWPRPGLGLVVVGVTAAGLLVCLQSPAGRPPAWEEYWIELATAGRGARMTFHAALLLVLTALGAGVLAAGRIGVRFLREAGLVVALASAALSFLCLVSSAAGNPVFSRTEPLQVTPTGALVHFILNFALVVSASSTRRLRRLLFGVYEAADLPPLLRSDRTAFGLLALIGAMVLAGIVFYLRVQTAQYRDRVEAEMQVSSDLKAGQLANWRQERLNDARALAATPMLPQLLEALAEGRASAEERAASARWLESYARIYGYRCALLLDATMAPLLGDDTGASMPGSFPLDQLRATARDREVLELAPYVDGAGTLRLDFVGLVRRRPATPPIGAVLLRTEPVTFFRPLLEAWPFGKQSARIGLWYRRDETLHMLAGHRPGAGADDADLRPFGQTRDIRDPRLLIARAAAGETALQEGLDVLGIPVIGMGRLVSGSDWLLAARIDSSEIYVPLRRGAWQVVGLAAAGFGLLGYIFTRAWRQRAQDLQNERIVAEIAQRRTAERLGAVLRHANDMIFLLDTNHRIIEANQRAVETYGWTEAEFRNMHAQQLRSPAALVNFERDIASEDRQRGAVFETEHQRRDGSVFPVELSVRRIELEGRQQSLVIIRDITDRRRAEAELRVSEERYRLIAENTSDIIWLTDLQTGLFTYVSPSVGAILGWRPEEVIGRQVGDFAVTGDEVRAKLRSRIEAFNAGNLADRHQRYDLELRHQDGSLVQVENSSTILRGIDGRAALLLSISRDVSDRKRAEARLRDSEERYRLIAENTSDVIWLYDLATDGFSYVSAAAQPVIGYQPAEMIGRDLTVTLPGEQAAQVREISRKLREAVQADGRSHHTVVEVDQRHKDGRLIPTEVTASVLPGPDGQPRHVLGITRDITERRRAHEALVRFSEELEGRVIARTAELETRNREIQALLDSIPDTVLLCDATGTILFRHLPPPAICPAPLARSLASDEAVHDSALSDVIARLTAAALSTPGTTRQDFDLDGGPGEAVALEVRATAIGSARVLLLFADITARKELERATLAHLEREKQLSALKSQFVSVASHEFRTPLAAAMGSLELLEKHLPRLSDQKRGELFGRTRSSLARLSAIISNVLSLSRADSGRVTVKRMMVDLPRFVRDIVEEAETADRAQHPVAVAVRQAGGPDTVPVDTNLLHHIISNLMGNALRYSPAGSPVTLTLVIEAARFMITVADEGIGVPPEERARVFDPFMRGSNVGSIGGTGLGLSIVKRYTELMGGHIELLDTTRGAAFQVTVPLSQPHSPP